MNIDHIKPWSTHKKLRLDINNLRLLCTVCHTTPFVGEKSHAHVLTEKEVRLIRQQSAEGFTWKELARYHQVCESTVRKIVHRKSWKHVSDAA